MKNYRAIAVAAVVFAMAGSAAAVAQMNGSAPAQGASPAPANGSNAPQAAAAYQSQGFNPGFDDLMTMLVQPRHIKLFYAGKDKNWELAAAEARDLRQSFGRIVATIPNYQGSDVDEATGGFLVPGLDAVDAAAAAADPVAFTKAYKQLTDGCNACHTYMEHPFIVIKVPASPQDSAHPDQDYMPAKE